MTSLKSPAKINWYLKVLNKRQDGFHNIESVMQTIGLFDDITIEHSDNIEVSMNPSLGISMEENIVFKTVLKFRELTETRRGVRININKQIPSGAGLGGGSSNAATTLLAINSLWSLNLGIKDLCRIAKLIGSDVPFFLNSPVAIVRGRGDVIEPLTMNHTYKIIIIKPDISVSTAWAYNQLQRDSEYSYKSKIEPFTKGLIEADFKAIKRHGINDFEKVIFSKHPELEDIKKKLLNIGADYAMMSGSGSAIYGVFKDSNYKKAYDTYYPQYQTWIADTINRPLHLG